MVVKIMRNWQDQRVHHLYTIGIYSKNDVIRREIMKILGALGRAGSEDATWALDSIKKSTKNENDLVR